MESPRLTIHRIVPCVLLILAVVSGGCRERDVRPKSQQIRYTVMKGGTGRAAEIGDIVEVAYEIRLPDGSIVVKDDSNIFELGAGVVIEGIDQAIRGMRTGEHRLVDCPPHLHWGRGGYGGVIPPDTKLIIDVQLKSFR